MTTPSQLNPLFGRRGLVRGLRRLIDRKTVQRSAVLGTFHVPQPSKSTFFLRVGGGYSECACHFLHGAAISLWTVMLLLGFVSSTSHGQSSNEQPETLNDPSHSAIDYLQDVRPILRTKCATCHSEVDPGGGLRLDSAEGTMQGGDSGAAIVPGNSAESRLIHAVLQTGDLLMPPPDEAKPLEHSQIEILRRWIDQGAIAPEDESQVSHWAFQKPSRPPLPASVPTGGSANAGSPSSVDRHIILPRHSIGPYIVGFEERAQLVILGL